jgi:hypothetical protein
MSNEIRAEVESILSHAQIEFTATYRGQKKNALGGDKPMDEWVCDFLSHPRGASESFEFFTGLGLRAVPPWRYGVQGFDNGLAPRPGSLLHEQWMKQAKTQKPHAADVLHSLILDSSAVGQSFESWCADYGYDSDSRKAFGIYEACQQNADKLARVLNANDLAALKTALQDY